MLLQQLKAEIIFLQETHLSLFEVSVLIGHNISFEPHSESNKGGRYV